MASVSLYLQNAYLNWCLLGSTPTRPTVIYMGLASAAPTETTANELSTSVGYARQLLTFASATTGDTVNTLQAMFGPFTVATTVYGVQLWDAETVGSGNMLWYGSLGTPRVLSIGDYIGLIPSAMSVSIS